MLSLLAIIGLVVVGPSMLPDGGPFDSMVRKVHVGDQIRVEETGGMITRGRLTSVLDETLTIETAAGQRRYQPGAVTRVAVRRSWAAWGALAGAGAGAAIGYYADSQYHDFDIVAVLGAGAGAIVGHFVPRMKTVYRAPAAHVSLAPRMSRDGVELAATLRW